MRAARSSAVSRPCGPSNSTSAGSMIAAGTASAAGLIRQTPIGGAHQASHRDELAEPHQRDQERRHHVQRVHPGATFDHQTRRYGPFEATERDLHRPGGNLDGRDLVPADPMRHEERPPAHAGAVTPHELARNRQPNHGTGSTRQQQAVVPGRDGVAAGQHHSDDRNPRDDLVQPNRSEPRRQPPTQDR